MALWLKPSLLWLLVVGASCGVFVLYTHPDFVVTTANQLWLCVQ